MRQRQGDSQRIVHSGLAVETGQPAQSDAFWALLNFTGIVDSKCFIGLFRFRRSNYRA